MMACTISIYVLLITLPPRSLRPGRRRWGSTGSADRPGTAAVLHPDRVEDLPADPGHTSAVKRSAKRC